MNEIKFYEAINLALVNVWRKMKMLVFGLGATDPKRIFGTTMGLVKYGSESIRYANIREH